MCKFGNKWANKLCSFQHKEKEPSKENINEEEIDDNVEFQEEEKFIEQVSEQNTFNTTNGYHLVCRAFPDLLFNLYNLSKIKRKLVNSAWEKKFIPHTEKTMFPILRGG